MFSIGEYDITILVIFVIPAIIGILLFIGQLKLCLTREYGASRFLPCLVPAAVFILSLLCLTGDSGDSYLDLSCFIAAIIFGIGLGLCVFIAAAWITAYLIKRKRT